MSKKMVAVDDVVRGGAITVGGLSAMALIAFFASGAIIIQPFIAIALLTTSVLFYIMTLVPSAPPSQSSSSGPDEDTAQQEKTLDQ